MADLLSSGQSHFILGLCAGLVLVFWDWRIALPGLLLVQLGIGALIGTVYLAPAPWPTVHFGVLLLACLILSLSILQTRSVQVDHSGEFSSILFRSLVMGLAAFLVWSAGENIAFPLLSDATKLLFLWLAVLAIVTLGLAETTLFSSIAIILWLIPVQAFFSILFPLPVLIVLLGVLQLLAALACSYLLLAEDEVLSAAEAPATDPGLASTNEKRLSIAAGARILWYAISYRVYILIRRRQHPAARKG